MIDKTTSRAINNQMNRAVIYCRKSTDEKTKQIRSLDDQLLICNRLVKDNDLNLIHAPFIEAKSGWESNARIEFFKMLDLVKRGKVDIIVVWDLSRIGRNGKENGEVRDLLKFDKIRIITESGDYDSNSTLEVGIRNIFDEEASNKLSKIVKSRLRLKAERGDYSGVAPLGYLNTPKKLKGTRDIVIDKKRVDLVRKWWELMLTGKYTVEESLTIITKKGLRNRKDKIISKSAAYAMFRNIFYAGKFNYGGEQYFGNHKPIVKMSEWLKIQRFLDRKGKKGNGTLGNPEETAFQGVLRCGECGCAITMQRHIKKYVNGTTQIFWYYACTKRKKHCSQRYLNARDFDIQLKTYLDNIRLNPEFSEWLKKAIARRNEKEFLDDRKIRELNTKRLDKVMDDKKILFGMKNDGLITEEDYQKQKNKLLLEENNVRENFKETLTNKWGLVLDNIIDTQRQIKEMIEEGDIPTKQMALQTLGLNLTLKDKKIEIKAKDAFIFFRNIQNEVWSKNGLLEPNFMPILPHNTTINRTQNSLSAEGET